MVSHARRYASFILPAARRNDLNAYVFQESYTSCECAVCQNDNRIPCRRSLMLILNIFDIAKLFVTSVCTSFSPLRRIPMLLLQGPLAPGGYFSTTMTYPFVRSVQLEGVRHSSPPTACLLFLSLVYYSTFGEPPSFPRLRMEPRCLWIPTAKIFRHPRLYSSITKHQASTEA